MKINKFMKEQLQKGGEIVISQFSDKKKHLNDVSDWVKTLNPEEMQKEENINAVKNYILWSKKELVFLYDNYERILKETIKASENM